MAIENLNDGVGRKIVEALKMQSDEATDENMITEDLDYTESAEESYYNDYTENEDSFMEDSYGIDYNAQNDRQMKIQSQLQFQAATQTPPQSFVDTAFNQSLAQNLGNSYTSIPEDIEYPANVAVIRQLISKLPSGVSKQTGAMIIRQTMEALGISMGSVLQEAKQVQENLSTNSKECQRNIIELRKQIGILESKAQQYQRQSAIMTDIINLFIQTR